MPYIGHSPTNAGSFVELDDISSTFNGSGDNGTDVTAFTMQVGEVSVTPSIENLLIMLDGVVQQPTNAFSISGSTLTFTEAPQSGTDFYGILMGQSASVGQGTITASELAVTGDGTSGQLLKSDADGTFTWIDQSTVTAPASGLVGNTLASGVVSSSLTSVGTIGTGVWNASVIASAKLDADTAHLSEAQTFSGAKTFSANAVFNGEVLVNNTSSGNAKLYIKGEGTSTANSLYITDSLGADILYVKDNKSAKFYGTLETVSSVGVGVSPTQQLEVAGDVRIQDARSLFFKRHGDNYAWRVRNESASDGSTYGFSGSNDLVFEVVSNSQTVATPAVASHTVYGNSANTLVLKETGNVEFGGSATFAGTIAVETANVGTPHGDWDTLVLEENGRCGITLISPTNNYSAIDFADADGNEQGMLQYSNSENKMYIKTAGTTALTLDSSQNATFTGYVDGVHTQNVALGGDANATRYLNLGTKDADNFCVVEISAINSNMVGSDRMAYARWIVARGSYSSGGYVATQLDDYGSGFDSSIALDGSDVRIACAYNSHSHSVNCIVRTINGQFTAISAETS